MEFVCSDCGTICDLKSNIKRHIKRKCPEATFITKKVDVKCDFCNKHFKTKPSLSRHLGYCKLANNTPNAEVLEKIASLEEKVKELNKNGGKTTTNVYNINNGTQNIQLNSYTNTSYDHITDEMYQKALRRNLLSIPELISMVHFNPEVPQNHNVYIGNLKENYAAVYLGRKWGVNSKNETISRLINDNECKLEEWVMERNEPNEVKKFEEYQKKSDIEENMNFIKEEVKLLLYNNRDMIKKL